MTALVLSLVISLWPHGVPGPVPSGHEHDTTTAADHHVAGRPVIRLGPVTEPTMTLYPARGAAGPGPAVIVFPGGGYRILAYDLEGTEICAWLNKIGVTAMLVKYRVGPPGGARQFEGPLQDAQRAVQLVREHAREWQVDPKRVGVLGFSAGGHLSAVLSNSADAGSRPDFTILIYPAYLETVAVAATPATFIVQAEDDKNFIDGTLHYYGALKGAGVATEMHLFSSGGHGYGMRPTGDAVTGWPVLAEKWLHNRK